MPKATRQQFGHLALAGALFALMMTPASVAELFLAPPGTPTGLYLQRTALGLGFNAFFSFMLPLAFAALWPFLRRAAFAGVFTLNMVFVVCTLVHMMVFGHLMAAPSLTALLDTNSGEAGEFLSFYVTPARAAGVAALLVGMVIVGRMAWRSLERASQVRGPSQRRVLAATGVVAGVIAVAVAGYGWNKIYFALNNAIAFTFQVGSEVMQTRAHLRQMLDAAPSPSGARLVVPGAQPRTHLLIIGESATSRHMSLYGYGRETTPNMDREQPGLQRHVATDVCSSKHATYASISDVMLGGKELGFDAQGRSTPNLMSMIRDAGLQTHWLSNQPGAGYGSMVSFWTVTADSSNFISKRDYRAGYDFDEGLLEPLSRMMAQPATASRVIVVHLMGVHPGYRERYPQSWEHWPLDGAVPADVPRAGAADFRRDIYNAYDNAMRYNDHVVGQMLKMAADHGAASVVYFSDHGQNLGANSPHIGHSTPQGPRQGYEVPLVVWEDAKRSGLTAQQRQALQANLGKPFSLDRLRDTLLPLYGIEVPGADPKASLLSAEFVPSARHCDQF